MQRPIPLRVRSGMRTTAAAAVVALIAGLAAIAMAAPAQAYPDTWRNLTVNRQVVDAGQSFTATATSNTTCAWTLEWNGESRSRHAADFATSYTAPVVERITRIPLHGTCRYQAPTGRLAGARSAPAGAGQAVWHRTIMITVRPRTQTGPPPTGGSLPNTGGPGRWVLLLGLALAAAGTAIIGGTKGIRRAG